MQCLGVGVERPAILRAFAVAKKTSEREAEKRGRVEEAERRAA